MSERWEGPDRARKQLSRRVGAQEARKLRARRERHRGLWFGLGMFGVVGWSIAVPTVFGTLIGYWIDRQWPGPYNWTLTLLLIGLAIGCASAWRWIVNESRENR